MQHRGNAGFVLPLSMLLAASLLFLAVLFMKQGLGEAQRAEIHSLHRETEILLEANAETIERELEKILLKQKTGSGERAAPDSGQGLWETVISAENSGETTVIGSFRPHGSETVVAFLSPNRERRLAAGWQPLAGNPGTRIAWCAEDAVLGAPDAEVPPFWPLPAWDLAPHAGKPPLEEYLDAATAGRWRDGPWIPSGHPLPFTAGASPALVPVIRELRLRFGIFASGPARQREKTIRIRFYLEGSLWNPYNREMQLHPGTGKRPVMQVVFWNLPEVRIRNKTLGVSTGWLRMDDTRNATSGAIGLHGWISLPGVMKRGEIIPFSEPDPQWQPEGLARTLHGGFRIGPGDSVEVEFREPPEGLSVACLDLEPADPLLAARNGEGWFRLEGFTAQWPLHVFPRADSGSRPFLLEEGSLAFRNENSHTSISLRQASGASNLSTDPRKRVIHSNGRYPTGTGSDRAGSDIIRMEVLDLIQSPPTRKSGSSPPRIALFSWPTSPPGTLLEASDLPSWEAGFRLGSAGAGEINRLLDEQWSSSLDPEDLVWLPVPGGNPDILPYHRVHHINSTNDAVWNSLFKRSSLDGNAWPLFPQFDGSIRSDFGHWDDASVTASARAVANHVALAPFFSVAEFFNGGILHDAFPHLEKGDYAHALLPLRAWMRDAPHPATRGSAWILHLLVENKHAGHPFRKSARIWLLEVPDATGGTRFERIRFEWTDPAIHAPALRM